MERISSIIGNDFEYFKLYLSVFMDTLYYYEFPDFIIKYLNTKTMKRLRDVTQFCGSDYTHLFNTRFRYTRFHHSIICALIVWNFTYDRKETIKALLHDTGTPCFAHTIDFVLKDTIRQESSEKKISLIAKLDNELMTYLKSDGIEVEELDDLSNCHILENKHPRLCADRLDGVLHTSYIWLNEETLDDIKEIIKSVKVLENEDNLPELGFSNINSALEFAKLVSRYAKILQSNKSKYVNQYISEVVSSSIKKGLITIDDLYTKKESELVTIFNNNFSTWMLFSNASNISTTDEEIDGFKVSVNVKKRNVIPLVEVDGKVSRIDEVSNTAKSIYDDIENYHDKKYGYIKNLKRIE